MGEEGERISLLWVERGNELNGKGKVKVHDIGIVWRSNREGKSRNKNNINEMI